jgi:hypothetical protein
MFHLLGGRCLATVLSLAYVATTVGVRWPEATAEHEATPYPCQGHQCGCRSAEQCWSHCCCFTASQRLAWAAANHVEPPADLAATVAAENSAEHLCEAGVPVHSCCHKHAVAHHEPELKTKPASRPGFHATKCHGINTLWVTTGAVVPPQIAIAWNFDWTVVGTVPNYLCSVTAVPDLPAVPPRRDFGRLAALAAI